MQPLPEFRRRDLNRARSVYVRRLEAARRIVFGARATPLERDRARRNVRRFEDRIRDIDAVLTSAPRPY